MVSGSCSGLDGVYSIFQKRLLPEFKVALRWSSSLRKWLKCTVCINLFDTLIRQLSTVSNSVRNYCVGVFFAFCNPVCVYNSIWCFGNFSGYLTQAIFSHRLKSPLHPFKCLGNHFIPTPTLSSLFLALLPLCILLRGWLNYAKNN